MRFFVAITDSDWFTYLSSQESLKEVNFWQPSGNRRFRALQPGEPFLFKLHSPLNFIVGGGFFRHFTILPVSFAWNTFTTSNGANDEREMRARLEKYRRLYRPSAEDYEIGCILLQSPFFFTRDEWIRASDWDPNIVQGKTYDTVEVRGQALWEEIEARLKGHSEMPFQIAEEKERAEKYGKPRIILPRLGQGLFRVVVTDAYSRRCAFTGSPVLHVLDAAHIRPFANDGPHDIRNGILFRQDVHTLFDKGYITVTSDYQFEVSNRIKEEFENGHEYYSRHGKSLTLPDDPSARPSAEFLTWHNEKVFAG